MNKSIIKIAFIGAGSIGSLFGGYLANISSEKYEIEMNFFGRKAHIMAINENGLILEKGSEEILIESINGYTDIHDYLNHNPESRLKFVFLTTKAYDIDEALVEYKGLIKKMDWIVILQNGIGNEDIVKHYVPKNKIIRAITSNGALIRQPGKVKHTGLGFTRIGFPFKDDIPEEEKEGAIADLGLCAELMSRAGIKTEIVNDIIGNCWEKIFVNIGINAFGALTRLKNGELINSEKLRNLIRDAIEEALKIARQRNINLSKKNYIDVCFDVARNTKDNLNSMLQDIIKGKKTEIDFINGRIVTYSEDEDQVPINRTITYLIKGLENSEL
ncbi:MAG: 2-dehydropantoate 2-reductase [Promethearchaeota archaeon]|jgi:2-dehydropantoate 2-reductase|nr:MAG: 2-dehydropantoate 2-reductase [Candidatus Lokiarchaeota archaeon]